MKDYTICKPQETTQKKQSTVFSWTYPNCHCTKKEMHRLRSCTAYFYVQTVLLDMITHIIIHFYLQGNTQYFIWTLVLPMRWNIRKRLVQWEHLHPFRVWEWPRVNFTIQQLCNKFNYRQWLNESCRWHIWKVTERKIKSRRYVSLIWMRKKSSVVLKTSSVLASNGGKKNND
jgi:hypothetical protein